METLHELSFDIDKSSTHISFIDVEMLILKLNTGMIFDGIHTNHLRFLSVEILD